MKILLNDQDLNTKITDSGRAIDVLALSLKQWTENQVWENNIDAESESTKYVIDNYDFEARVIDWINTHPEELPDQPEIKEGFKTSDLLAGAYLALNHPEDFAAELENYTEEIKEKVREYWEVDQKDIAYELAQECQKAVDEFQKQNYHEWLHGDHYNFAGILNMAAREYGAEDVDIEKEQTENIIFDFTDEQAKEFLAENQDLEDGELEKLSAKQILNGVKIQLAENINYRANSYYESEKARKAQRAEGWKRTQEYKKQRAAEEEAERRAKLSAMKK